MLTPKPAKFLRQGSVLIITGASSGLGRQLALQYCQRNIRIFITGRDQKRLQQTKRQCQIRGKAQMFMFLGDLTNEDRCRELVQFVVHSFHRIDCLLLNAGVNSHFQFKQLKQTKIFEELMKTNFYANVNLTKYALPYLRNVNGRIIVISSLSGKFGLPSRTAYCASKFALTGFFQSLRTQQSIKIILIYPTSLQTPMRQNGLSIHEKSSQIKETKEIKQVKQELVGDKREDPKECAEIIVKAVDQGKMDVYIPLKGWIGLVLQPLFPNFIREKLKKAAKL